MKANIPVAWLLAAAMCLASCGGSNTSQYDDPPPEAPVGLSYPDPNLFTQGITIAPLVPMVSGTPTNYQVAPELPGGLVLNSDGTISGTPTEPRATATYLVTAGNSLGTSAFGVRITVLGRFTIGGVVSGLTGTGLVLTNNGGDNLAVIANGTFTFAATYPAGALYSVAVASQPTGQTCGVANGNGNLSNRNYGDVVVSCSAVTNKARRSGYVACFYLSAPESMNGYVVDEATGAITPLGTPIFATAPATELLTGCGLHPATMDSSGMWLSVLREDTDARYVFPTPFKTSP